MWLLEFFEPWDEVEEKWQETHQRRMKHLRLSEEVYQYVDKFPALKQPLGWKLVSSQLFASLLVLYYNATNICTISKSFYSLLLMDRRIKPTL